MSTPPKLPATSDDLLHLRPTSRAHVAMLATHGMGHLIPLAELAKLLATHHNMDITLLTFPGTSSKAQDAYLASLPSSISYRSFDAVNVDDIPPGTSIESFMSMQAARSVPAIAKALAHIKSTCNLVAYVTDLFGADTFDAAYENDLPAYLLMPSNFLLLSLFLHMPELNERITCDFRDLPEPLELPGCVPIPGPDLLNPVQTRSRDSYEWILHHGKRFWEAKGILVNTFEAIEPEAARVFREKELGRPTVYPVGPLIRTGLVEDRVECIEWLDRQPVGSVLFVSFGSGGTLTSEQMVEVALGLELSGQRFLWVVRSPSDKTSSAYFDPETKADPFRFMPIGFVERTKGVGFLVPSWAPQVAVLNHKSTGGFLSHCGWNSTLESVLAGVAMVAWPLYAEQRQNTILLVEGAKVALRPTKDADGVVKREEVARVVRELMEGDDGKEVKKRVTILRDEALKGLGKGGASYVALADVANEWKGVKKFA